MLHVNVALITLMLFLSSFHFRVFAVISMDFKIFDVKLEVLKIV